jgi:hypothetical protein
MVTDSVHRLIGVAEDELDVAQGELRVEVAERLVFQPGVCGVAQVMKPNVSSDLRRASSKSYQQG